MAAKRPVVEQAYYFEAGPQTLFRCLTTRRELVRWFLSDAKIKPEAGTDYTFAWHGGYSHAGVVRKVVKDKSLVLSWPDKIGGKVYETEVSFTLSKKGKGAMLKLRHTGFKDGKDWVWLFGAVQSGWAYYMTNLKSVLLQGKDLRSDFDNP